MVELKRHRSEPASLAARRATHPNEPWDALSGNDKAELRHQLNLEQEGLCIYCESPLGRDDGHVEHIRSKTLNPPLTFIYDNLAHSCNGPSHCGHYKKRQVLPIEPRAGANRHFALSEITGELSPAIGLSTHDTQRAKDTLRILGLNNSPGLNRQRQQYAAVVRALSTAAEIGEFLKTSPFR